MLDEAPVLCTLLQHFGALTAVLHMRNSGGTTAGMANRASQKPVDYGKSGLKLLHRTEELMQRTGGHALATIYMLTL